MKKLPISAVIAGLFFGSQLGATPFQVIRIGDVDGFGYGLGTGYTRGSGNPVNNDGLGVLAAGDELPSLNGDATVATGSGDDFDNRLGEGVAVVGAVNTGSTGFLFTDIALSTSYDASAASGGGSVWNHNTSSYGTGGVFPSPPSNTLPNQPGFVFDFFVATGDITPTTNLYFNLVFGDYDVVPASVKLTRADNTFRTVNVNTQPTDGLIQEASVVLSFNEVFSAVGGGWDGFLKVDFLANNEPYTAFDYVELSFNDDPGSVPTPAPDSGATGVLLGVVLLGVLLAAPRSVISRA
jgi:hypothetical protein